MTLSKRNVWLMVGLIIVSLSGLVALQASLLRSAMNSKESAFRQNVLAAMGSVAQALEEQEAIHVARELARRDSTGEDSLRMSVIAFDADCRLPLPDKFLPGRDSGAAVVRVTEEGLEYTLPGPQRLIVQIRNNGGVHDTVLVDSVYDSGRHVIGLDSSLFTEGELKLQLQNDSDVQYVSIGSGHEGFPAMPAGADSGRVELVRKVVSNLFVGEFRPVGQRLKAGLLDSLISLYLRDAGVDLDYAFGVVNGVGDSLALAQPAGFSEELKGSDLKVQLFPNDIFSDRTELAMFFPGRAAYLRFQMGPLLGATTLFMAIIIFCFVYSIRTISVQRRNARLMVDFVNNMTHEFKTPISTVALACEAILRPDVIDDKARVADFSKMIQSENKRMRNQTEKILQMAALEAKDYELSLSEVDADEVIRLAVDAIALQVRARRGSITCELAAVNPVITADKVHLEAIVHNLLDNANKYSPGTPSITVRTRNAAQGLLIEVEDKGIGLREEDQKRVFEKYFRVPSGDRHDVKGFGLGLSYVDLIMKAHGGRVALESSFGHGTTVRLVFPVRPAGR